jgi:hypothetical protein
MNDSCICVGPVNSLAHMFQHRSLIGLIILRRLVGYTTFVGCNPRIGEEPIDMINDGKGAHPREGGKRRGAVPSTALP